MNTINQATKVAGPDGCEGARLSETASTDMVSDDFHSAIIALRALIPSNLESPAIEMDPEKNPVSREVLNALVALTEGREAEREAHREALSFLQRLAELASTFFTTKDPSAIKLTDFCKSMPGVNSERVTSTLRALGELGYCDFEINTDYDVSFEMAVRVTPKGREFSKKNLNL